MSKLYLIKIETYWNVNTFTMMQPEEEQTLK